MAFILSQAVPGGHRAQRGGHGLRPTKHCGSQGLHLLPTPARSWRNDPACRLFPPSIRPPATLCFGRWGAALGPGQVSWTWALPVPESQLSCVHNFHQIPKGIRAPKEGKNHSPWDMSSLGAGGMAACCRLLRDWLEPGSWGHPGNAEWMFE